MDVMQKCCGTHVAGCTEMPLCGLPKSARSAEFPVHSAVPPIKSMDNRPSSFEESLAHMLCDLQDAVCRQHEIFAARADKTIVQTGGPCPTCWARSAQAVQAKHIADSRPDARPYRGPSSVNQAANLLAEFSCDTPVDDGRDIEAPSGAHGRTLVGDGPGFEELCSARKHAALVAVDPGDKHVAEDVSTSESFAIKKVDSRHSISASHTNDGFVRRDKSLAGLSRFGGRGTCRTHSNLFFFFSGCGPERRISVKRQLDFIKTSQALVGGPNFQSTGRSATCHLDCDWLVRCFMNVAVLSNVIVLGFQAESDWIGWVFVDAAYVLVFAFELAYRVFTSGTAILTWKDPDWRWNWFDIVLVIMTAMDVVLGLDNLQSRQPLADNAFSHVGPLRILRIIRILRIFRLSHVDFFRDLGLMVVGTIGGLRTLMWSLVMIAVPVYAVALFFTETLGRYGDPETRPLFSTVRMSMFTTFRCLVVGDCNDSDGSPIFLKVLHHCGWGYITVYCLASVGMSFGLFSVIVAIYVESTMAAAKANEAIQRQRRLEDHFRLSSKIFELVHYIYHEFKLGRIDKEFRLEEGLAAEMNRETFRRVIQDDKVRTLLRDCDVPEDDFSQLFDVCDSDGGGLLSLDEIASGIRKLRGVPSRSDVVWIMLRVQELQDGIQHLHVRLAAMSQGRAEGGSASSSCAPC